MFSTCVFTIKNQITITNGRMIMIAVDNSKYLNVSLLLPSLCNAFLLTLNKYDIPVGWLT